MVKVVGKQLSWLTLVGMSVASVLQVEACSHGLNGDDSGTSVADSELVGQLLKGVGPNVIVPALGDFTQSLEALRLRLLDWSTTIVESGDPPSSQALAQEALDQAFHMWQRLEVMQIGPAASSLDTIAGEDLRDEIYSWPTVNHCRVDQKTASGQWQEESFFEVNLVNAYGLDALEHLLYADDESVCNAAVPPLSDGSWESLGQQGVWAARADFATVLTDELIRLTDELTQSWSASGSNFSGKLARTTNEELYSSNQEALNAVYDALFYIETETKDRKLAQALGLRDCETDTCPDDLEGLLSGKSLNMLRANLEGFEVLFTGGEGIGFEDLLAELGHGGLADSMIAHLESTTAQIEAFEGSLYDSIETNDGQATELFDTLGLLTSEVKWDLATVIHMIVPSEAAGDND